MRKLLLALAALACSIPVFASTPVCLYQDVQSGPATGGEGGNGIYLNIYGLNFGSTQGTSTVTVNGTAVAQYLYWGADPTGARQQIGVQIASTTTGTGNIVVTTSAGSCSNLTFTVRTGKIYFIGSAVDTSAPTSCSTMETANSYATPWGLTNYASTTESNYNYSTMRTPYTYYQCMSPGDTLVFLNGVNYPYFDGRGWHASLTLDSSSTTSASFMTFMARPGATATLGGEGWANVGVRNTGASNYSVYAGLTMIGSGTNGGGLNPDRYDRFVGNTVNCPDCSGPAGALTGGDYNTALGNVITAVSTDTTKLPNGSNKTYHAVYFNGSNFEFAWNRVYNTAAYNGFQIHHDYALGYYNFSIHDNDIADVNGSGINLSVVDPSMGYVQAYNNIIHHVGLARASDGGADDPHNCIAVKGNGGPDTATSYSVTSNVVSIVANNGFFGGETVHFSNWTSATFLNGQSLTVSTTGLSQTGFQVPYTTANVASTADTGKILTTTAGVGTSASLTSNIVTIVGANSFTTGQVVMPEGFTTFSFLNGQRLTVLSTGLSTTQFEANFTHANVSSTADAGYILATGTNAVYNNTMYDCSSILNLSTSSSGENESGVYQIVNNQLNVTTNLANNVAYQPAYTYTSIYNVYFAADGTNGSISGSNNIFYSATTPSGTVPATTYGAITNPLYANSTPCTPGCAWTNYELQATSPAIGAGTRVGPVESQGVSNTYLTWDFAYATRPNPPAIGAFEYGGYVTPTYSAAYWFSW